MLLFTLHVDIVTVDSVQSQCTQLLIFVYGISKLKRDVQAIWITNGTSTSSIEKILCFLKYHEVIIYCYQLPVRGDKLCGW